MTGTSRHEVLTVPSINIALKSERYFKALEDLFLLVQWI